MKKCLATLFFCVTSLSANADIFSIYRHPNGAAKWQYIANTTLTIFILSLATVTILLTIANRRAARANRELTDIKTTLEDRESRRTANLIETTNALKSREQYITNIVESMPLMLIGLNEHMEIIQWNRAAEMSTGRPIASVIGKKLWDAYPAIALTPEQVSDVLHGKKTVTINHSQRDQYYFDITLYALTDRGETGVVILVDDITKQMKAENKVSERDKISAMGELASAMAYDINLPLESILSYLSGLKEKISADSNSDDAKAQLLEILKSAFLSAQQAKSITQNLLDLSLCHNTDKIPTDIALLMDQSIILADNLFTDDSGLKFKTICITRNYQQSLPLIPCFQSELKQVFVGLLRNAFHSLNQKYSTQPNPIINIEIGEFYDSLWVRVEHNGKLLSAHEQEDIFQPFYSISNREVASNIEQRLSYSYFIIANHHDGQMSVTSDEKYGTCFNIQIPL